LIELDEVESAKQRDRVAFLALMDGVIEALPDALIAVDLQGNIIFFNQRAELMFGYPRAEILGQPVEKLMPERNRAGHVHARELYSQFDVNQRARTMGVGMDLIAVRGDGREFLADITLSRMITPKGVLILSLIRPSPRATDLVTMPPCSSEAGADQHVEKPDAGQ
jgi:protein-histidine pros-kinase